MDRLARFALFPTKVEKWRVGVGKSRTSPLIDTDEAAQKKQKPRAARTDLICSLM
jgi:hypothetical protein